MTDQQHPITPPPELVQQWLTEGRHQDYCSATQHAIAQAARWGSDQELEACIQWIQSHFDGMRGWCDDLRAARRPKPPSLKEQALALIQSVEVSDNSAASWDFSVVRRALESLPD